MGKLYVAGNVLPPENLDHYSTIAFALPVPTIAQVTTWSANELKSRMLPSVGTRYRTSTEQAILNELAARMPTGPNEGGATATFVRTDATTQGTWRGVYGTQGSALAADATNLPAYAQLTLSGQSTWTWDASTTNVRALQRPAGSDRFAATWFRNGSFTIDLNLTDGSAHQVALYGVDWDARSRTERIEVLDAASGTVLDTRTLTNFVNGQYLVWTITGHVVFRVTLMAGGNAVISGLFIGP
jgi:hypothetical protein